MPAEQHTTTARLTLRLYRLIAGQPEAYNVATLAEAVGEPYSRVRRLVAEIEQEAGLHRVGTSQLLTLAEMDSRNPTRIP